jgi:hypothetical protein
MKHRISILIVNFNSSDFIDLSLYALKKLTKNPYKVFIIDNGSKKRDFNNLKKISEKYENVSLERREKEFDLASMEHGTALNILCKKVDTEYFSILDADATWLKKDWDEILINKMNEKVKVIGTQAPEGKPQDFPLMFAILFETKTFKELRIDFRPKDLSINQDTGWEIRDKYLKANFEGLNINFFNTRTFKKGPFGGLICGEYYFKEGDKIFASHFGRGSTLGMAKYKGISIFLKISFIRGFLARIRGHKEKKEWISICRKIINKQN